jgi:hypothetical protein
MRKERRQARRSVEALAVRDLVVERERGGVDAFTERARLALPGSMRSSQPS